MSLPVGPEYGSPAYDATIHPAAAEVVASQAIRAQQASHRVLFGGSSAAAEAFSHYRSPIPSPLAVDIMGLAAQRDLIERAAARRDELPYPGVSLPIIPFHGAPATNPIVGGVDHLRFHKNRRR